MPAFLEFCSFRSFPPTTYVSWHPAGSQTESANSASVPDRSRHSQAASRLQEELRTRRILGPPKPWCQCNGPGKQPRRCSRISADCAPADSGTLALGHGLQIRQPIEDRDGASLSHLLHQLSLCPLLDKQATEGARAIRDAKLIVTIRTIASVLLAER